VKLFSVDMRVHSVNQFHTVDGERFLVNTELKLGARTPLTLVLRAPASWKNSSPPMVATP
jgi:hypothetical protein